MEFDVMMIVWLAAFVVFAIAEAATVQLVSIWFALGSIAALIFSLFDVQIWIQITVFLVVSFTTFILTRPLIKKHLSSKIKPTNADRIIGTACMVLEDIDNIAATGVVSAQGKTWTARSNTGVVLKAGTLVRAIAIDGVKLIVIPFEENRSESGQ